VVFSDDPPALAAWYRRVFELQLVVDQSNFIGLRADQVMLFIQRTSEGHRPGVGGIRPHFVVQDCRQSFADLLDAGARQLLGVSDAGGEWVAAVQDPEGNPLGLIQPKG